MLNEREKEIAWKAFCICREGIPASVYAAVEAVKAEWERTPAASPTITNADVIQPKPVIGNKTFAASPAELHEHRMVSVDAGSGEKLCACGYREGAAAGYKSPAEPATDVVEAMCAAYRKKASERGTSHETCMTAAYAIARQHCEKERDKQWEKAIAEIWHVYLQGSTALEPFLQHCRKRLTQPVETLQERSWRKH